MAPWFVYSNQSGKGKGWNKGEKSKGWSKGYPPNSPGTQVPLTVPLLAAPPSSIPSGSAASGWMSGVIRRLFVGKGFGFIARDDLPTNGGRGDVFLHFSDLDSGVTSADLSVGMRVKFRWEASRDSRGPGGRARLVSVDGSQKGNPATTVPRRAARTGRVYRKDLLLTMQQLLKSGGEFEERRPFGTRSSAGPLPSRIVFPFTVRMPDWYWEQEDERALAEANDQQRLQLLEARLDLENGADLNNCDTFGEDWALETWSYHDAVAANQRLAAAAWGEWQSEEWEEESYEGLPEFFQPVVHQ